MNSPESWPMEDWKGEENIIRKTRAGFAGLAETITNRNEFSGTKGFNFA